MLELSSGPFDAVERQDDLQFHTLSAVGDEIPDNFSY
jgi:hypothetical protein